jgi:hypothetical protein
MPQATDALTRNQDEPQGQGRSVVGIRDLPAEDDDKRLRRSQKLEKAFGFRRWSAETQADEKLMQAVFKIPK